MKIYELAIVLLGGIAWAAITTALDLPWGVAFIGGLAVGWGVARWFNKLRG